MCVLCMFVYMCVYVNMYMYYACVCYAGVCMYESVLYMSVYVCMYYMSVYYVCMYFGNHRTKNIIPIFLL